MSQRTISIIISAAVALVVSLGVVMLSGGHSSGTPTRPGNQSLAAIQQRGTIRVAYAVGAPLLTIDPNTKQKSGIFFDIVNAAAAKMGLKTEWTEEVGYGEMIQGLKSGRYDIVGSGVWINSDRARGADFTIPVYYDAVYAYVRTGGPLVDADIGMLDSPKVTLSTMDGELGQSIAKASFSRARTLELPQSADFSQMIANVVAGKADAVFLSASAAREYQAANPGKIVALSRSGPIRVFPDAVLLPQGGYELRQAFNYALLEMINDGEVEQILKKYEKQPGSFLRVAPPYREAQGER